MKPCGIGFEYFLLVRLHEECITNLEVEGREADELGLVAGVVETAAAGPELPLEAAGIPSAST